MRNGLKRALVISLLLLLSAAGARAADAQQLLHSARRKALNQLLQQVRAIAVDEENSLGDLLDGLAEPVRWDAVLGGSEIERPVRYYGTGECEVRLRISADGLRRNISQLVAQHAAYSGVEADKLPLPRPYLSATATQRALQPRWDRPKPATGPPEKLEGWGKLDALQRAELERFALSRAKDRIARSLAERLAGDAKSEELVTLLTGGLIPDSKAYLAGGILEMRVSLDPAEGLARIKADETAGGDDGQDDQPDFSEEELENIAKQLGKAPVTAVVYLDTERKPVEGEKLLGFFELGPNEFPGLLPPPKPMETQTEPTPEEEEKSDEADEAE